MNSLYQKDWKCDHKSPYSYYLYYIFVNMISLNNWREERGLNTFVIWPHFGEAGDTGPFGCCFSDFAR
jgi:AMP deaminase